MPRRHSRLGNFSTLLIAMLFVGLLLVPVASSSHDIVTPEGVLHWDRNNPTPTAVAQAYMVDHTGSRWPVNASAVTWNQSADIGVYWIAPGDCPFHCVHVRSGNYGPGFYGKATLVWNNTGHLVGGDNGTRMQLNTYYSAAATRDRHVTCQEMGHTIGLDHQGPSSDSCMNDDVLNTKYPNNHDWVMLGNIYDH
jgi:hypothetical protein